MKEQNRLYDFFLFAKLFDVWAYGENKTSTLEYDRQYDRLCELYDEYCESEHNRQTKGGYHCILDFLNAKGEQYKQMLNED